VTLTGGQTYYFQVGGFVDGTPDSGTLSFSVKVAGLGNDAFANATPVTLPFTIGGIDTSAATTEQGETVAMTSPCSGSIGKTLWYRITPAQNMTLTAATAGSSTGFDTVIVLYQGTSLAGLARVACDDDSAVYPLDGGASRLAAVSLTGGLTYYLQVGGYQGSTGSASSGTLALTIGSIDTFATPGVISKLPFNVAGLDTSQASTQTGEPVTLSGAACTTGFIGKTVWFKYTAPSTTTITIDTAGSNFDTVLRVMQGASLATLSQVGCDDDGIPTTRQSRLTAFAVTAGQTYYLQVGGWTATNGGLAESGTLNFNMSTP
jgi:hypothetical protein